MAYKPIAPNRKPIYGPPVTRKPTKKVTKKPGKKKVDLTPDWADRAANNAKKAVATKYAKTMAHLNGPKYAAAYDKAHPQKAKVSKTKAPPKKSVVPHGVKSVTPPPKQYYHAASVGDAVKGIGKYFSSKGSKTTPRSAVKYGQVSTRSLTNGQTKANAKNAPIMYKPGGFTTAQIQKAAATKRYKPPKNAAHQGAVNKMTANPRPSNKVVSHASHPSTNNHPSNSSRPSPSGSVRPGNGKGGVTKPSSKTTKKVVTKKPVATKKPAAATAPKTTLDSGLMKRAQDTVNSELDPQINSSKDYEAGVKKIYTDLATTQGTHKIKADEDAATTRANTGAIYDKALTDMQGTYDSAKNSSDAEKARLGISGNYQSTNAQSATASRDAANTAKANSLSAQDRSKSAFDDLMNLTNSQTQSTGANKQTQASLDRSRLEAGKPGKVKTLYYTLSDAQKARDAEAAQQKFMNTVTNKRLGISADVAAGGVIKNLAGARKSVADSKRPTVITRRGKQPKVIKAPNTSNIGSTKKVVKKKK
jgi:hypothetical protein